MIRAPPRPTLFPYPPLFRSAVAVAATGATAAPQEAFAGVCAGERSTNRAAAAAAIVCLNNHARARHGLQPLAIDGRLNRRSEEHTSELQSRQYLVCRLLLEK